eukprot:1522361-Amphidinium_carterae.1
MSGTWVALGLRDAEHTIAWFSILLYDWPCAQGIGVGAKCLLRSLAHLHMFHAWAYFQIGHNFVEVSCCGRFAIAREKVRAFVPD